MKSNITPIDIAEFFQLLDDCSNVQIEEAKGMDSFTLENVKQVNRGNNCLHTELFCDKFRIEIQTYKELSRKGEVCVMLQKVCRYLWQSLRIGNLSCGGSIHYSLYRGNRQLYLNLTNSSSFIL